MNNSHSRAFSHTYTIHSLVQEEGREGKWKRLEGKKKKGFRVFRKDVDSEWRTLCGRLFQVVGAVKEKDLWPKVSVETRGTVRLRESVDERS